MEGSGGKTCENCDILSKYNISKVGIIGAGNLAQILIKGFLSTGLLPRSHIIASDINPETLLHVKQTIGVETTLSNVEVVGQANVVVVAVEPQVMATVLGEIQNYISKDHLLISVAAGFTIKAFTQGIVGGGDLKPRVVRVMANTPTAVQCGASVLSLSEHATDSDKELVTLLFSSVGLCEVMQESYLDAVTGVSGSGPAYMYLAIEALSDGGVKMGLPRKLATRLAAQTLVGAGKMVLETGLHPGELKDAVTSPGGTTIARLHALEKSSYRASLINAVEKATMKSKELGELN